MSVPDSQRGVSIKGAFKNPHFIPTAALRQRGKQASRIAAARKKFLAYIVIHMRRGEFFPAPRIWAKSEFLEAPLSGHRLKWRHENYSFRHCIAGMVFCVAFRLFRRVAGHP